MLLERARAADMNIINTMAGKCTGGPTRVQVRTDGVQASTLDYAMCSTNMVGYIVHMVIEDDQMDSDHKPLVLTIDGLRLRQPNCRSGGRSRTSGTSRAPQQTGAGCARAAPDLRNGSRTRET